MLNFDRYTVKHGTQNIQNDCHYWLSGSFRVHQIRFRPGLRPGPHWGSLQRSPDPVAGLRDHTSKGEGRGRGKGRGAGNVGTAPFRKFLDTPLWLMVFRLVGASLMSPFGRQFQAASSWCVILAEHTRWLACTAGSGMPYTICILIL